MQNRKPYCGVIIRQISDHYYYIFVNITIPVSLIGMILNLLNILVFTRKTMNSPPNLILAHLAFVDFLLLLASIAQFWISTILAEIKDFALRQSYAVTIVRCYIDISVALFQFISIFLTVQLAAWRYIAVLHPLKERHWCNKKITRNVLITGYVLCCVLCVIPYHLSFDIEASNMDGKTKYTATFKQHPIMLSIRDIIYGLVMQLLPSVVLVGLTCRIVVALLARKTRREELTSSAGTRSNMKNAEMRQQTNRSTAILLAVATLFFIAEFPRGMLWLLKTIDHYGWYACYYELVGIFVTIVNINASITFIVYYTLSQQFRTTFKSLFSRKPRTSISYQTHAPLASGDTEETNSGWKTSEV
ncbi:sex peptide receptor-like [Planococcus citri]|uniref:sex peptide receptor-like n=1 Tax=Planococcus citri TaxID=170843 RepID=UPI0031F9F703